MTGSLVQVLTFALIPLSTAILGAVLAVIRPPSPVVRSFIQHLAAGVVFSVVAVELLPDITHQQGAYVEVALGFVLGMGSMLAMRSFAHRMEQRGNHSPIGLLVGVGVDILLDGFLIGVSFAAGAKEGTLLTLALALEMLSLGLAVATALSKTECKRLKVVRNTAALFVIIVIGAGLGTGLIAIISSSVLEILLSFGLAALMYLVTEELLVEAHKEPETPLATGMFFIGFLVFLLIGMVES